MTNIMITMKKYLNLWLLAALLCGMSLGVASCKDDDNDSSDSEEQQGEQSQDDQSEAALKFWSVVGQLVSMADATADYKNETFEPIIGVEGDEPGTRIVYTNSAAAAAERFANLVDAGDVTEETASRQWSDPEVGTLNYTKVTDGTAWATVDVDIRQVPHLSRIIYRAPSQGDHNGGVAGNRRAYYRFGDVIERKNKDNMTEYWICVRPAFDPEGKGDSHWISVSPVPSTNQYVKHYKYDNKKKNIHVEHTYVLPTMLTTEEEHMQNLAELLFAIFNPEEWYTNVLAYSSLTRFGNPSGMKIFHDFHCDLLEYHNYSFWKNVQDAWRSKGLCTKLFGFSYDDMKQLVNDHGIYMLYKGYSWKSGNAPLLWQALYYNTPGGVNANMQTAKPYSEVRTAVYNQDDPSKDLEFDITKECSAQRPYLVKPEFFGDSYPRFIVRTAKGSELSSTRKYSDNEAAIPGIDKAKEVYRYYNEVTTGLNADGKPEYTYDPLDAGLHYTVRSYFQQGDIVRDANGLRWICVQPSAYGEMAKFLQMPYSYFVSFDKGAVGDELENIPHTKELAAQMLFSLSGPYHNYEQSVENKTGVFYKIMDNWRTTLGVEVAELFATRDTLHKFSNYNAPERVPCDFSSALYYDENGNINVLRLVNDYTAEQASGGRDWSWRFYECYAGSDIKMSLDDLGQEGIHGDAYKDKWVYLPWVDIYTRERITDNTGPRFTNEDLNDLSRFIYTPGRSVIQGTAPANMYREPLIAFAVRRVYDPGRIITSFDNGVKFTELSMMKDIDRDLSADEGGTNVVTDTYDTYHDGRCFLDEKPWAFGMTNDPNRK